MATELKLRTLCLHLIDPVQPEPTLSDGPLPVGQLRDELTDFVQGHLGHLLRPNETQRTRAAQLHADSPLPQWRQRALADDASCFAVSCEMAKALHAESPHTATAGLLAVAVFREPETPQEYFAAFKFRASAAYKIQLTASSGSFGLEVQELDNCLPEPGEERLYKSAVMPHPNRAEVGLKVHDDQTRAEPAQYFTRFLGCTLLETEKAQVRGVFEALGRYAGAGEDGPGESAPFTFNQELLGKVPDLFDQLMNEGPCVTYETLVDAVDRTNLFENFSPSEFGAELARTRAAGLQAQPQSFERARMRYVLPNGIVISGPARAMMQEVVLDQTRTGVEFRIPSHPDFKTEYD